MKIAFVALLSISLFSCSNPFAPEEGIVTNQTDNRTGPYTPISVLRDFQSAYNSKDSLFYSELLDEDFKFIYNDPENPGTFAWGREIDLRTTGRLFRAFGTIDLTFNDDLTITYLDSSELGEIGDSTASIITSFNLKLDSELLQGTSDFTFRKKNSSGERWKIIQWIDYSN